MTIRDVKDITSFKWGTVVDTDPLQIRLDGDDQPLSMTPDTLVDPMMLANGNRVRVELSLRKAVVHGKFNGLGDLPTLAPGTDLNNIMLSGWYIQRLTAETSLALNYPLVRAGHLEVSGGLYGTGVDYVHQTYTEYYPQSPMTTPRQYRRMHYNGLWSDWSLVSGQISGMAARTSTQSVANGSAYIQMTGLTSSEALGMTFASNAFTIQEPGLYFLEGRVVYASNATGNRTAAVFVNGVAPLTGVLLQANTAGNSQAVLETGVARLAAGDVVDVRGWQTSGAALNSTAAYLKVARIGP